MKKKSCEMIACPPRHPFLFRFFFLDHFFRPSTYQHQGLITRTFFFLCRFIIQILMRCLVPCVWTSSTKLGRHYMISQIFLRASSLNSSLIPIPQIRSMGTQQPCIFTGKYECQKKCWMMISDYSVFNYGSCRLAAFSEFSKNNLRSSLLPFQYTFFQK